MGTETGIAWTDHTFNPWWGCVKVSPGCTNCYAESWDARWKGGHWGKDAPRRFFGREHWREPLKWNDAAEAEGRRARVFCASMADVFEDLPDLERERFKLWELISITPHLDWQLLTKRPENIAHLMPAAWHTRPGRNVWLGTTVEDQERADERIPELLKVPATVRFLSVEPMLEPIALRCTSNLSWVIVGGESGSGARPFDLAWARSIVRQCKTAGVPVFVKQLGAQPVRETEDDALWNIGISRKGGDPSEWPEDLRVREFPR